MVWRPSEREEEYFVRMGFEKKKKNRDNLARRRRGDSRNFII